MSKINPYSERNFGFYQVGDQYFVNKSQAMIYSSITKLEIQWKFNEEVYSNCDWMTPIPESLDDVYKQKALHLREKYDYLSLFFSGGVDSANILYTFIKNNILLDEIVMMRPKCIYSKNNKTDRSNKNLYSELEFAAIPFINKHLKDTRTKVRFIDIDEHHQSFLLDEKLMSQYYGAAVTSGSNDMPKLAMTVLDPVWDALYSQGKTVCHILGHEKPLIDIDENGLMYFNFRDVFGFNFEPMFHTPESLARKQYQVFDFFYWNPDFTKVLIKQCQLIKNLYDTNPIFNQVFKTKKEIYNNFDYHLVRIIYPEEVVSIRNLFMTGKMGWNFYDSQYDWIYNHLTDQQKGDYSYILDTTFDKINPIHCLQENTMNSKKATFTHFTSKRYYL
jgi:hypothetical protein